LGQKNLQQKLQQCCKFQLLEGFSCRFGKEGKNGGMPQKINKKTGSVQKHQPREMMRKAGLEPARLH